MSAKAALIGLGLLLPVTAGLIGKRLLQALGILARDARTANWSFRRDFLQTFVRTFLRYGGALSKTEGPPVRAKIVDASPPKMPPDVIYSAVRIARRKFEDDPISGMDDPIEAEIVEHESLASLPKSEHKVFLKFYGGGHVLGEPSHVRAHNVEMAQLLKGKCVAPTYRLAPAEPFPHALHDAVSAYMWLIEDCGYSSSQIVIGGNSAGGNLASALAIYLLQNDLPQPAGVCLWTPWVDMTGSAPSRHTMWQCILPGGWGAPDLVSGEKEKFTFSPYVPSIDYVTKPLLSPLFADPKELKEKNHPPTWFEFGDVDRLRDEGLLYFTRLAEAGVPCRAELYAEATHLFAGELSFGKQAKLAHKLLADFVNQVTAKQPIKTELVWVTHDCEIKDLGGVEGARKVLRESFDEYLGFVKDKERIRKGWSRFGFLDIWNAVVPGCL